MFLIACEQEEIDRNDLNAQIEHEFIPQDFHIKVNSLGSPTNSTKIFIVSNAEGEILFETIGNNLDSTVSLVKNYDDSFNATIGYFTTHNFIINTYLDVNSGSTINFSEEWENHDCFRSKKIRNASKATIYITDITEVFETHNSLSNAKPLEFKGDTLIMEGFALSRHKGDNQIVIKETIDSEFRSIIIPSQDWTWYNETQSMETTISFNDFTPTNEYKINLKTYDLWGLDALVCENGNRLIALQNSTNNLLEAQEGIEIKIYLNETILPEHLKFHFYGNNLHFGYSYNWIHETMPQSIELEKDMNPAFHILNNNEFWIDSTFNYNINIAEYHYVLNQIGGLTWRVISKGGSNIKFKKHELPNQLYSEFPYLLDVLDNPVSFYNYLIKTEQSIQNVSDINLALISVNNTPDQNFFRKRTIKDID